MRPRYGKKFTFEDELVAGGAKIYRIKDTRTTHPRKFENDIANIVKKGNYKTVHSHIDFMSALSLAGAKKGGAKNLISHSHNTYNKNLDSIPKKIASYYLRTRINSLATKRLACGVKAGEFLYGKGKDFTVIPNGINLKHFSFNKKYRDELREKYALSSKTKVILNVGRLEKVKNQAWLIRLFEDIYSKDRDCALFIIGDGTLREALTEQRNKSLAKKRIFLLPSRDDINKYYSLADFFVLPSFFEGVPTVGIEAQAAGLKCYFSPFVPEETQVTNNVSFIDIDDSSAWENKLLGDSIDRTRSITDARLSSFDITKSAKVLEEVYDSL